MTAAALNIQSDTYNPYKSSTFAPVPNWLMCRSEISPGAKLCYGRLCQYAGPDGECFPKISTLAGELGVSESQTRRYIKELTDNNLIHSHRRGLCKSNTYTFLTHIWQLQDESNNITASKDSNNDSSVPCTDESSGTSTYEHSYNNEGKENSEKKNTTTAAVVSPLPDKELVQQALDKLPDEVPQTVKLERIIKKGIVQHDLDYVLQSIDYTAHNIRDFNKFPAYLDKCIKGAWAEGWQEPEPVKPVTKPVDIIDLHTAYNLLTTKGRAAFDEYVKVRGFSSEDIQRVLE